MYKFIHNFPFSMAFEMKKKKKNLDASLGMARSEKKKKFVSSRSEFVKDFRFKFYFLHKKKRLSVNSLVHNKPEIPIKS